LEKLPGLSDLDVATGDIRDPYFCDNLLKGVDVVFNLAALIAIPYSYVAPQSYLEVNVGGTLNLCQSALKHGVQRFIQISTSEVYGTAQSVPIPETHPLQPQSPYSASKIGADSMALAHYHSWGLPVVVARPFNTYGPRQSARAVIPSIISQILGGADQVRLGDTRPTRDFNYVTDTCQGMVALAEADAALGQVVNIGSGTEVSIDATAQLIQKIIGRDVEFLREEQRIRPKGSEVFRLCCDNSLLCSLTNAKPQVGLEEGLRKTIDWFRDPANLARFKTLHYSL
jgi:NAD dependent epimerase/dehydratase